MANTVLTSLLGVVFWVIAARMFPASAVGVDAAAISAAMALSSVSQCNLHNTLARFVPAIRGATARVISSAYAVNTAAAVLVGLGFVVVAPRISADLAFLRDEPVAGAMFVAAVALWGIFALQDAALVALRGAPWIVLENAVFGTLKIAALPLLAFAAHGVALSWALPMFMLLLPVNLVIYRRLVPRHAAADAGEGSLLDRLGRRDLARFLGQDYVATVLAQAMLTLLPLSVLAVLGPRESAWFYVPFTMVLAFDALFWNVATSLTVEGAFDERRAAEVTRTTIRRFALFLLLGVAVMVVAGPLALHLFGPDYARHGATVLRLLAVASIPRALLSLFMAVARLEGWAGRILAAQAVCFAVLAVVLLPLERSIGLEGVGVAWLAAHAVVALAVAPSLLRFVRYAEA